MSTAIALPATPQPDASNFDVIIIGAGISGINAAYRLQERLPQLNFTILEGREQIGGTWDLFQFPGIRSDSDLYTFGFPWKPWGLRSSIAEGPLILSYIKESAAKYGIDKKIQFGHQVESADWSSTNKRWSLNVFVRSSGKSRVFTCGWILFCTGYYDYKTPLQAVIPGISNFNGKVIHPQFWPTDCDYTDKDIVIIGSGATAITLLPAMTEKAKHVTMLQRSPSYIVPVPREDGIERFIRRWCPSIWRDALLRLKWTFMPWMFFTFCRLWPKVARKMLRKETIARLPKGMAFDPDFNPTYNPWEQRVCFCPDGDFYKALRKGKGSVVTGVIDTVTDESIKLTNGKELHPDVIITATGLNVVFAGKIPLSLDGELFTIGGKHIWKHMMIEGLPNSAFMIGYTNASWTLGADANSQLAIRIMKKMERDKKSVIIPKVDEGTVMKKSRYLNLSSTYLKAADSILPVAGDKPQWAVRTSYFKDIWDAKFGDISTGVVYS